MPRIILYPFSMASETCSALANSLGALRVFQEGRFWPRADDLIINWGHAESPTSWFFPPNGLNAPSRVATAVDKLAALTAFKAADVQCPPFTSDREEAKRWIERGGTVFCRIYTRASGGRGIFVSNADSGLVPAPLYVRCLYKRREYRVHVFRGEIIDVEEKRRMRGRPRSLIRSHLNGYVYCRTNVVEPPGLHALALKAVAALHLDFGAVDIIDSKRFGPTVLEVNTAPGLEGTTLRIYAEVIHRLSTRGILARECAGPRPRVSASTRPPELGEPPRNSGLLMGDLGE
jgi:RimK-like ATP-grasp domain